MQTLSEILELGRGAKDRGGDFATPGLLIFPAIEYDVSWFDLDAGFNEWGPPQITLLPQLRAILLARTESRIACPVITETARRSVGPSADICSTHFVGSTRASMRLTFSPIFRANGARKSAAHGTHCCSCPVVVW